MRPSCYACAFKNIIRQSVITLADFWGVQSVMPEMYNHKGTSLVFINSQKGNELFNRIKGSIKYQKTDIDKAIVDNSSMIKSVNAPLEREAFVETVINKGFCEANKKFLTDSFAKRIKRKIRQVLSKLFKQ